MISDDLASLLVTTFNDPAQNPVHLLFNQFWQHASDEVKAAYVAEFERDELAVLASGAHYAEPLDLEQVGRLAPGTLGRAYHDWIVDNGLTAAIATNYRQFHEALEAAGMLDGMPEGMKFAVLRGFQTHDFQHVVTGYDSSGRGEIALQAFCLAQLQFPYFAIWMSVVATRMTFVDPAMIRPMMDSISDGWQLGRRTPNIQCVQWEDMLDRPLDEVRASLGVEPSTLLAELASAW